jgi:hypothetical protein
MAPVSAMNLIGVNYFCEICSFLMSLFNVPEVYNLLKYMSFYFSTPILLIGVAIF